MVREINISVLPQNASDEKFLKKEIEKRNILEGNPIESLRIIRKSIDARKKPVKVNLGIIVSDKKTDFTEEFIPKDYKALKKDAVSVIIVGAGPAGLFAALKAIELGIKPIIIERGKDVDSRRIDVAKISREGIVQEDSNYCFGEGGAGTFSDGKLYTRSKKRGNNKEVLDILHQFGAKADILIDSHPHIGSDKLPIIIKNIRNKIIECGGEVKFQTKMDKILISEENKAIGIKTDKDEILLGPVFLATGHSARDTYRMLGKEGVALESKGLAIGVRLEHPQMLIDQLQYHSKEGRGQWLPAAEYSFVNQEDGRGVYTFCMCPGGVIVPAVSNRDQIVVNGMSASARAGKWANSGYVVEIHPEDISKQGESNPFEMLDFQEKLEKDFSDYSENTLRAPAQRISDFIAGRKSVSLPPTSYVPGLKSAEFDKLFPDEISKRLKKGLIDIGKKCRSFISDCGVMIGLESRTSSPIRIPRDESSLQHKEIQDLYPVGEGAGYAGGIVSSAIDGIRCMEAYYQKIKANG